MDILFNRKKKLITFIFLLLIVIFVFTAGFFMGKKQTITPSQQASTITNHLPADQTKNISGILVEISGSKLKISDDLNYGKVFEVTITPQTELTQITGPIKAGDIQPETTKISASDLKVGMRVKLTATEVISSGHEIQVSHLEAGAKISSEQNTVVAPYTPPAFNPSIASAAAAIQKIKPASSPKAP